MLVAARMVAAFHVGKIPPAVPSVRAELGAILRQAGWLLSTVNLITALAAMSFALCFSGYSCCWFAVIGFLPALPIKRLGYSTGAAAVATAMVTFVNVIGNLGGGWLLQRVVRAPLIMGSALPMAVCVAGISSRGRPI